MSSEIIEHLKKIKYIGPFPYGTLVLLVNFSNALDEARTLDKNITPTQLKSLLKVSNILEFPNVEAWVKFKGDVDGRKRR